MPAVLVRKIDYVRWRDVSKGVGEGEVAADFALGKSTDLRTDNNAISLWRFEVESEPDWQDEAALVFAAGCRGRVEKMDFVAFDETALVETGVELAATPGDTRIDDARSRHRDAVRLDLRRFDALVRCIAQATRGASGTYLFTRSEDDLLDLLVGAGKRKRLVVDSLPKALKDHIREHEQKVPSVS